MKIPVRTTTYKTKQKTKPKAKASPSKNTFSKIGRATKRYSKVALKSMLLSKAFSASVKLGVIGMVVFTAMYGAYAFIGTTVSKDVIVSKSEIISRVSELTTLPAGKPDAVVRVQDPESLKKQNSFYDAVKEGDYILVYPQLAVIYDLRNNTIIGLKHSR
jgi:hypothetical protein